MPVNTTTQAIYFVDAGLTDFDTLITGLPAGAEVHILQRDRDGLQQMLDVLTGRSGIDALHILSHGGPAQLNLGNTFITAQTLDERAADFAKLGEFLNVNADILVYGCDVAQGVAGQAFVSNLAALTGADVAASVDLTGAQDKGGDWQLEYQSGQIDTNTVQSESYQDTLATVTRSVTQNGSTGTTAYPTLAVSSYVTTQELGIELIEVPTGVTLVVQREDLVSMSGTPSLGSGISYSTLTGGMELPIILDYYTGISSWNGNVYDTSSNYQSMGIGWGVYVNWSTYTSGQLRFQIHKDSDGDGHVNLDSQSLVDDVTVSFVRDNQAPVAPSTGSVTISEGATLQSNQLNTSNTGAYDPEGTALSFAVSSTVTATREVSYRGLVNLGSASYTASDGALSASGTITVLGSYANDTPSFSSGAVTRALSDTTAVDVLGNLTGNVTGTDPDAMDIPSFTVNGSASQTGSYGALAITSAGAYTFTPNNAAINALAQGGTATDTYTLRVSDGALYSTQTFTVNLTGANDAPVGIAATNTAIEDTDYTFTTSSFGFTDVDVGDTLQAVEITTLPASGSVKLSNVAVTAGQIIALADITGGNLKWTPAANVCGDGQTSLTVKVSDGTVYNATAQTLTFNVTPVNDAPVCVAGGVGMTVITENATNDNGQLVSDIIATFSDIDTTIGSNTHGANNGRLQGVAIYNSTDNGPSTHGHWEYKLSTGGGWVAFGSNNDSVGTAVSTASALLLKSDDYVRFVPDAMNGQTASFDYYAWDQSANTTAGTRVDVTTRGTTTPYSLVSDNVAITIDDVNDAPTIATPVAQTVLEDHTLTFNAANSNLLSFDDVDINATWRADSNAANDVVEVTLSVEEGTLTLSGTTGITFQNSTAQGQASITFQGTLTAVNAAVNGLQYTPDLNYNRYLGVTDLPDALTISISDLGNVRGTGDAASTALTASSTVNITVNPVNDAPVLQNAANSVPVLSTINENVGSDNGLANADANAATLNDGDDDATLNSNNGGNLISDLVRAIDGSTDATGVTNKSFASDVDYFTGGTSNGSPNEAQDYGVAIYGLSNTGPADGGVWQYSTNGGTSWSDITVANMTGNLSTASALLLRSTDKIRFVPDAYNGTTATVSYVLWDGLVVNATGQQGTYVSIATRGTTTNYSDGSDVATITVTHVNDNPVLDLDSTTASSVSTGYTATFKPRGEAVAVVDTDITIRDVDQTLSPNTDTIHVGQDTISQAVVSIATGALDNLYGTTWETLSFKSGGASGTATNSYSGSLGTIAITGNASTTVTLTGQGTWADYQTALQSVYYVNANPNAATGDRTITVAVTDNDDTGAQANKLPSNTATTTVHTPWTTVADLNGPTTGRDFVATYTEGATGVALVASTASLDNQAVNIKVVTLVLSMTGSADTDEKLFISNDVVGGLGVGLSDYITAHGITIGGNNTATLTLTSTNAGTGVTAETMQLAMRAVQYINTSQAPTVKSREVNVSVVDVNNDGVGAKTVLSVVPVNDAPVISVNTAHTVLEGGLLTLGTAHLNATDVDDAQATLDFVVTTAPTKGVLFRDANGNDVADSGEVLTAITNPVTSGALNKFTQGDLAAGIIKYQQTDTLSSPATDYGSDSFVFKVQDGMEDGITAPAGTASITITAVNDAPTLTVTASAPTFNEVPGTAVALFSASAISAIESAQSITQLVLTVAGLADGAAENLVVDGSTFALTNATSGSTVTSSVGYSVAVSGSTATVTLTHAGMTTTAAQTLVDALAYQNTSNAPTGTSRVVTLTSIKDGGGTANGGGDTRALDLASSVAIVATDSLPVLATNTGKTLANGALYTLTTSELNTTDSDTPAAALVYTIGTATTKGTLFKDLNSSGAVESGEVLTATSTFTQADLAAGLIKYRHSAADNTTDSFAFTVKDAATTLASANFDLTITTAAPTKPGATGGGTPGGNSTDGSDALFSGVSITPPTGETVKSLQFTLMGVQNGSKEIVTVNGQAVPMAAGTTTVGDVTYVVANLGGGSFTLTVTDTTNPGWSGTDASVIVNGARYQNTNVPPTAGVRSATLDSVTDYLVDGTTGTPTPVLVTSTITLATFTDLWTLAQAQAAVPTPTNPNDKIQKLNFSVTGAADSSSEVLKINGHEIAMTEGTATLDGVDYTVAGSAGSYTVSLTKAACWTETQAEALLDGATYVNNASPATLGSRAVSLVSVVEADVDTLANGNPTPSGTPTSPATPLAANMETGTDLWTLLQAQLAVPMPTAPKDRITTLNFAVSGAGNGSNEVIAVNGHEIAMAAGSSTVAGVTYTVTANGSGSYDIAVTKAAGWTEAQAEDVLDSAVYINRAAIPSAGNRTVQLVSVVEANSAVPGGGANPTPAPSPTPTPNAPGSSINTALDLWTLLQAQAAVLEPIAPNDRIATLTFSITGAANGSSEAIHINGRDVALTAGTATDGDVTYTVTHGGSTGSYTLALTKATCWTEAEAEAVLDGATYINNAASPTAGDRSIILSSVLEAQYNAGTPIPAVSPTPGVWPPITSTIPTSGTPQSYPQTDVFSMPAASVPALGANETIDSITIGAAGIKDGANEIMHINGQAIALVAGSQTIGGYSYTVTIDTSGNATVVLGTPDPTANFTRDQANTIIDAITYSNNANPPTPGPRNLTVNNVVKENNANPPEQTTVPTPGIGTNLDMGGAASNTVPLVTANTTANVVEGQTVTLTSTHIAASDAQQPAGSLVFRIASAPAHGSVLRDANGNGLVDPGETIASNGTFTQLELASGTIKYRHDSSETGSDQLSLTVSDGIATTTAVPLLFHVSRVNDMPTLSATGTSPSFTEGGSAVALYSAAAASTGDTLGTTQLLTDVVLTVSNIADGSSERLLVNGSNTIELSGATASGNVGTVNGTQVSYTVSKSGSMVTVTLTHAGLTADQLQMLVTGLQYENTNTKPTAGTRTLNINQLKDGGGSTLPDLDTAYLSLGSTITVVPANNAPGLTGTGFAVVEGGAFTLSTTQLATTDVDTALSSMVYTVAAAPSAGTLYIDVDGNGVNNSGDTTLALNSTFTQSQLTSGKVRYLHDGSETADPLLAFSVSDGNSSASAVTVAVTRTAVNDPPTLNNLSTDVLSYAANSGLHTVDVGADASVTDPDSSNFDTGVLRVSISLNNDGAHDVLAIQNVGTGAGQIGVSGANVSYAGVTIGTFTGGAGTSDLVVTLNASADATATSALLKAIQFSNDQAVPTLNSRSITFTLSDGDGGLAQSASVNVNIPTNTQPIILNGSGFYTAENTTAVTVISATDPNSRPITFSVSGGADAAKFSIDATTGALRFVSGPDYENPTDVGTNNVYNVTVRATNDQAAYNESALVVNVVNVVDEVAQANASDTTAPAFGYATVNGTSLVMTYTDAANNLDATGTPPTSAFSVSGNTVTAVAVNASAKTVTLTLDTAVVSGAAVTVTYTDPSGGNDTYAIQDAAGNDAATLASRVVSNTTPAVTPPVEVVYVNVPPPVSTPTPTPATTGSITETTVTNADGSISTITMLTPSVPDAGGGDSGAGGVTTLNLATDGTGASAQALIQATVPAGVGLRCESNLLAGATLRQQLISATNSLVHDDAAFSNIINEGIDQYVPTVQDQSQVVVRTITLTMATGSTASPAPIVIDGAQGTGEGSLTHPLRGEALVIDAHALPVGTVLEINNIEFAIIIGAATVTGGLGRNYVIGDGNAQTIVLGVDDDILHGGAGNDVIGSKGGNDQLFGEAGNDTLFGGVGADVLTGGTGSDVFQFAAADESVLGAFDTITDLGSEDKMEFTGMVGINLASQAVSFAGSVAATVSAIRANASVANQVVFFSDGADGYLYVKGAGEAGGLNFDGTLVKLGATHSSPAFDQFIGLNAPPVGNVTISGTATQGQTLTALNTLMDADGLGAISYQWSANGTAISGATQSTLLLGQSQVGKAISVLASYTDGHGAVERVGSFSTSLVTSPTPTPTTDTDGVAGSLEDAATSLLRAGITARGDGNGDGVADAQQSNVASAPFLRTSTSQSDSYGAAQTYITLVADSSGGQIDTGDSNTASLSQVHQLDAPARLPDGMTMPLGLTVFIANVGPSSVAGSAITETFSLYVDASLQANGYWVENAAGAWVNLASAAYGGQVVTEGGKTRLDFKITDGGEFDADHVINSAIVDSGAPGSVPLSVVGCAPAAPADGYWF